MAKKGFKITIHGVADYNEDDAGVKFAEIVAAEMKGFLNYLEDKLNQEDENGDKPKFNINASSIDNVHILGHGNDEYPEVIR